MYWSWQKGGLILGLVFLLAVVLVKPIGVSTQFVILDGLLANAINNELVVEDPTAKRGYSSSNAYLNKSGGKYAASVADPINYSFVFVLSMVLGGFIATMTSSRKNKASPLSQCHQSRFGHSPVLRYLLVFTGGVIVLWGARLAGGCTSGHMMSGMMQTALSGYAFAAAAFVVAVPTATLIYKNDL